jgi:hypothetical protein
LPEPDGPDPSPPEPPSSPSSRPEGSRPSPLSDHAAESLRRCRSSRRLPVFPAPTSESPVNTADRRVTSSTFKSPAWGAGPKGEPSPRNPIVPSTATTATAVTTSVRLLNTALPPSLGVELQRQPLSIMAPFTGDKTGSPRELPLFRTDRPLLSYVLVRVSSRP